MRVKNRSNLAGLFYTVHIDLLINTHTYIIISFVYNYVRIYVRTYVCIKNSKSKNNSLKEFKLSTTQVIHMDAYSLS